jgi:hypothetical protein
MMVAASEFRFSSHWKNAPTITISPTSISVSKTAPFAIKNDPPAHAAPITGRTNLYTVVLAGYSHHTIFTPPGTKKAPPRGDALPLNAHPALIHQVASPVDQED